MLVLPAVSCFILRSLRTPALLLTKDIVGSLLVYLASSSFVQSCDQLPVARLGTILARGWGGGGNKELMDQSYSELSTTTKTMRFLLLLFMRAAIGHLVDPPVDNIPVSYQYIGISRTVGVG